MSVVVGSLNVGSLKCALRLVLNIGNLEIRTRTQLTKRIRPTYVQEVSEILGLHTCKSLQTCKKSARYFRPTDVQEVSEIL